jgi:hypothetical protein
VRAQSDVPVKFRCVVKDVRTLRDHVHVRCANRGLTGVYEFAAEADQPYSRRVSSAALQAWRARGSLMITYAPSIELNPEGCDLETCRKIIDAGPFPPVAHAPPVPTTTPEARPANANLPEPPPAAAAGQPTRLPQSPDDAILQHTNEQPAALDVRRGAPPRAAERPPPFTMDPIDD